MDFFNTIMAPFTLLIKHLYLLFFGLTLNHGFSIVLLSFVVSLLLLPVFILIEKAKKRNDSIRKKMQPVLDEIKRVYKGQERYYYIQTLYRQHNYSTFRSLIPILSLLLQIPFFIAAYQFLETYEPLKGVSFGFIKDLSQPDAILGGIHLLPIVMTIINLITAYFYTRHGNASERKQSWAVAGLFLILLYSFPSGLVLYWTMNNLFSFLRLFVTNREVFKDFRFIFGVKNKLYLTQTYIINSFQRLINLFLFILILAVLSQLNWSFGNNFDDIWQRVVYSFWSALAASILFGVVSSLASKNKGEFQSAGSFFPFLFSQSKRLFLFIAFGFWFLTFNIKLLPLHGNSFVEQLFTLLIYSVCTTLIISSITWYLNGGKISVEVRKFFKIEHNVYRDIFWFLLLVSVSSQIFWAAKHSFNDIVLRISLAFLLSWIITIVLRYIFSQKYIQFGSSLGFVSFLAQHKRKAVAGIVFVIIISLLSQVNWALKHNFSDFAFRVLVSLILSPTIVLIITAIIYLVKNIFSLENKSLIIKVGIITGLIGLYFTAAGVWHYESPNKSLLWIATIFALLNQFFSLFVLPYYVNQKRSFISFTIFLLLLISVSIQIFSLVVHLSNASISILPDPLASFILSGIFFGMIVFLPQFQVSQHKSLPTNHYWLLFWAMTYLGGFVLLWHPLLVYSSFAENFPYPAIFILESNVLPFLILLISIIALYHILPTTIKRIVLTIAVVLVLVFFFHNTLMPVKVGVLQENKFVNESVLLFSIIEYFAEAGLMLLLVLIFNRFICRIKTITLTFLVVLNVSLILQSVVTAVATGRFTQIPKISKTQKHTISLSKEKENIVIVLLDMFHGWYMDRILKENPELYDELSGFVWYKNTISVSSLTSSSLPPLLGGYDYTVDKLNQDSLRTLNQKMTEITEILFDKVKRLGYSFISTDIIYSQIDRNRFDAYLPKWHESWDIYNSALNIVNKEIAADILWQNSLFFSAPLALKNRIYNGGLWLNENTAKNINSDKAWRYNFLRLLPFISDSEASAPSFVILHSMATHHPWDIVNDRGEYVQGVSVFENNQWAINRLAEWLRWMKTNQAYDNSKIIIVSDHGPHWGFSKDGVDWNMPLKTNPKIENPYNTLAQFPLLLVKEANATGQLTTSSRFMSNADLMNIAFNENNPIHADSTISRTLPSTFTKWHNKIWEQTRFEIENFWLVTDSAYNQFYWKIIK